MVMMAATRYHFKTAFIDEECIVEKRKYGNGRIALQLVTPEGEPVCTATVNLPDMDLAEDFAFIKDYSENEGILSELIRHGIVEETHMTVDNGYVEFPVCRVLI